MRNMSSSTRWLVGIGVAVVAVMALSIVVAIVADGEQEFDAGTPEATAQGYLRALRDRDAAAAVGLFTSELRSRCDAEQVRESYRYGRDFRATIRGTHEGDSVTEVDVRITEQQGEPLFGSSEYRHDEIFVLEREDGEWRISEPPWPLFSCSRILPAPRSPARQ